MRNRETMRRIAKELSQLIHMGETRKIVVAIKSTICIGVPKIK
jgi:hypothetical protein